MKSRKWRLMGAGLFAFALLAFGVRYLLQRPAPLQRSFRLDEGCLENPMMGYARSARYSELPAYVSLLYVDITWRELEPEEGVFAWESIEEENQLTRWREEGKHIVLRFVCDIPDDEAHLDIPDWLYGKMDGAGTAYDMAYGRGFSPDYGDPVFLEYHEKAVQAMGERYGRDGFVSYVELGSLGHWGEWHVRYADGIQRLPLRETRERYVEAWIKAFPHAKLLMRRPFAEAEEHSLGLYNDMFGHAKDTQEWMDWIAEGGAYSQTGEEQGLVPMEGSWKTAPVGGELTSSIPMEQLLGADLKQTAQMLADSHTTFLGPKIADPQQTAGYETLLRSMGYRLWISEAKLSARGLRDAMLSLTWNNAGVAPFYFPWDVCLYVEAADGYLLQTVPVELSLPALLPGEVHKTETMIPDLCTEGRELSEYRILLGILDPMNGRNAVHLAMQDLTEHAGAAVLFEPQHD